MASADPPPPQNTYVIDIESAAETARLIEQDKLVTKTMGGLFPEQPDLSSAKRILDIACGPGGWVLDVAFQYPHLEVTGVDINPTMIAYARAQAKVRRYDNTSFQVMDVTKPLEFSDASFDLVNARFIVWFMDRTSWPFLLAECLRVLKPGGKLRFTEPESVVSNSPALQLLNGYVGQALFRQGRTFPVDGITGAITHRLGKLLHDAGAEEVRKRSFCLDASYGSDLYPSTCKNLEVGFILIKPYLIKSGILDEATYHKLYNALLIEIMDEDFTSITYGLTVWGSRVDTLLAKKHL